MPELSFYVDITTGLPAETGARVAEEPEQKLIA